MPEIEIQDQARRPAVTIHLNNVITGSKRVMLAFGHTTNPQWAALCYIRLALGEPTLERNITMTEAKKYMKLLLYAAPRTVTTYVNTQVATPKLLAPLYSEALFKAPRIIPGKSVVTEYSFIDKRIKNRCQICAIDGNR